MNYCHPYVIYWTKNGWFQIETLDECKLADDEGISKARLHRTTPIGQMESMKLRSTQESGSIDLIGQLIEDGGPLLGPMKKELTSNKEGKIDLNRSTIRQSKILNDNLPEIVCCQLSDKN